MKEEGLVFLKKILICYATSKKLFSYGQKALKNNQIVYKL